ncbi:MAG: alpha/beta hydrolase [Vulcanimicrobiaceae bacterium]
MDSENQRPGPTRKLVETAAATAAVIGATAALVALSARNTERAHPAGGRFVDVTGVRVHYLERGTGPVVVLVHGNAMSSEDYLASGIIDRLATRYRVIAFDRPGFGYTQRPRGVDWTPLRQAELIHDAMVALEVSEATVVGHSLGSLIVAALAIAYPSDVRAAVLLSGYYYPSMPFAMPPLAIAATALVRDLARFTAEPIFARLMSPAATKLLFSPAEIPESFATYPLAMSRRPSQIRATTEDAYFMESAVHELEGRYARIDVPVEVLAGDGDRIVDTVAQSRRLAAQLPNARLTMVPASGHMIHFIAPERVVAAIDAAASRAERATPERSAS